MAGFTSTGPLDLQTIGQAVGDAAPHSLSEYYNISFTDGSSTPSAGPISIGNFLGKTIGSGAPWTQQAKLVSPRASYSDMFGLSVSVSGDYAIVGAYREDPAFPIPSGGQSIPTDAGAAYIYVRSGTTWTLQQQLTASDAQPYDNFGFSVAIKGSDVVVGAPYEDPGGISSAGSAYVFTRSGTSWSQQAKLTASSGGASDYFGDSVAIDGNYIVVASRLDDIETLTDAGSAYIFVRSGTSWSQQAKLTAFDAATLDRFGSAVAIEGTRVVIGAASDDEGGNAAGATYIFDRSGSTWSQTIKLINSDAGANDQTGYAVSISGNTLVTGAYFHTVPGAYQTNQGAAYVYTI